MTFRPPLSIYDAIDLVQRSARLLADPVAARGETGRDAAGRMIDFAREYCQILDDRHSPLGSYRWYPVAEVEASTAGLETLRAPLLRLPAQVERVSAIAFTAARGDVSLWSIAVRDLASKETTFETKSIVYSGLPMTDIRYFRQPTNVAAIEARCGTNNERATLTIYAGVTREPEYAKRAIFDLEDALAAFAEKRDADVVKRLGSAEANMKDFKSHVDRQGPKPRRWFFL